MQHVKGALILQGYSLKILGALAIIKIALAVSFKYDQDHIKYLFMETLKIGFYVFCIQQWVGGGMMGIANLIFTSFEDFRIKSSQVIWHNQTKL